MTRNIVQKQINLSRKVAVSAVVYAEDSQLRHANLNRLVECRESQHCERSQAVGTKHQAILLVDNEFKVEDCDSLKEVNA